MITKTQRIFNEAILKSAELCKMLNEEGFDYEDKEVEKINDEISNLQIKLLDLPYDFGEYDDEEEEYYLLKDLDKYIKDVVGKNYFSDKRCWSYLYDIVYDIQRDIGWNL